MRALRNLHLSGASQRFIVTRLMAARSAFVADRSAIAGEVATRPRATVVSTATTVNLLRTRCIGRRMVAHSAYAPSSGRSSDDGLISRRDAELCLCTVDTRGLAGDGVGGPRCRTAGAGQEGPHALWDGVGRRPSKQDLQRRLTRRQR